MNLPLRSTILSVLLTLPLTLHSTDIYTSSQGAVQIRANINPHIVPGDPKLGNTVLVVSAPATQGGIHIATPCEHTESILHKEAKENGTMIYVLQVNFPTACESTDVSIGDWENIFTDTTLHLPIESFSKLENSLINTDSTNLLGIMRAPALPMLEKKPTIADKLKYLQVVYKNLDVTLQGDIARDILHDRENTKYRSPVAGYTLPSKDNRLPGTGRPYRRDTTDGIHHGWDIMAPIGTPVQALSKGKIVRIQNGWKWEDFDKLKRGTLSKDDELLNLDIFRGNQVWLQTMDGNVTFYSHLSKISPDIVVGSHVEAGTYLGNIGTTGVPEKDYKDVHLHFEVQQNPFREDMKHPVNLDIMRWDYAGEHLSIAEVRERTREMFE